MGLADPSLIQRYHLVGSGEGPWRSLSLFFQFILNAKVVSKFVCLRVFLGIYSGKNNIQCGHIPYSMILCRHNNPWP